MADPEPTTEEGDGEDLSRHRIEAARSSRSRCRTCRRRIEKGKPRLGVLLEGPYGTGYLWHHLACAARRLPDEVEAAYASGEREEGLELPPLEELRRRRDQAEAAKARRKDPPYLERAPSGRSRCKTCGETVGKDAPRVVLAREVTFGRQTRSAPVFVHPRCVPAELERPDSRTDADTLADALRERSELPPGEVEAVLKQIRAG